jgi:hypothetical protein
LPLRKSYDKGKKKRRKRRQKNEEKTKTVEEKCKVKEVNLSASKKEFNNKNCGHCVIYTWICNGDTLNGGKNIPWRNKVDYKKISGIMAKM